MQEINNNAAGFASLGLPQTLLTALKALNFTTPTPIQYQSIPALLEGQDILGQAQTGTGKTAAFGLPALTMLDYSKNNPQLLVLAPTRELAIQVTSALNELGREINRLKIATLYGGQPYGPQINQLKRGAQIITATPGRLMDHLRRNTLKLDKISFCVLDEADEMLNMGFLEDVQWILEHTPSTAQMALFSATMPPAICRVARQFLKKPVHIKIQSTSVHKVNIKQQALLISGITKMTALERIIEVIDYEAILIFVRTRSDTSDIADFLKTKGHKASSLNGDMNQTQRELTVNQLKKGNLSILIATDVAARGLDIARISHVINYDLPTEPESYIHRIGRTGRAGRSGEAILFIRANEFRLIKNYERLTASTITFMELPDAKQLSKRRISLCQQELTQIIANNSLDTMKQIVAKISEGSEHDITDLAAALLFDKQRHRPLIPQPDPIIKNNKSYFKKKNTQSFQKRKPDNYKNQNTADWQTYYIKVGRNHGVKPGDIVGAIANEAALSSQYIGNIKLFDEYSHVQLPRKLPKAKLIQLKRTKVRNQMLAISLLSE